MENQLATTLLINRKVVFICSRFQPEMYAACKLYYKADRYQVRFVLFILSRQLKNLALRLLPVVFLRALVETSSAEVSVDTSFNW